jgi:hypothetical protein
MDVICGGASCTLRAKGFDKEKTAGLDLKKVSTKLLS